ncbi:MAG: Undecaprenyl-phosphate glucose phosphotransferase [Flavipsychrobacter sp.]|jgi:putative colanic acid biosynthesis UDP-glucose lipid carrier transferase|nr:Undecaprenyl-phosphate glucose phosphotransferase [Flavipsychrobacter sp.]
MEQPFVIKLPVTQSSRPAAPQSDIAEIREMFREINHRYMVYQPPAYYSALKRAMDVTISMTFILLVMSWVYPIVALLVKLTSRGPVFFIQKRTGYKGVEFDCFKFRTMHVNADADTKQATSNDKRITTVGKFLRLTHLDETPQFFNVLLGDMSIVGPRPHMLYHTRYYSQIIPYYNLRHEAVPGMTGMAQIKGYIGEINVERELRKRVQWDVYYLKNRSVWLDVTIVFTTFAQVIGKGLSGLVKKD